MPPSWETPPVIPYYGGKYRLSDRLVKLCPPHNRYFEVFFGGGSLFFKKGKAEWSIINDLDNDLVNLYFCVAYKFDKFQSVCKWLPRSRELYDKFRIDLKKEECEIGDCERAVKYYYMMRNAFNSQPYNTFSKQRTSWNVSIFEELKNSRKKLENTTIENIDFRKLIEKYPSKKGDFLYLDPPYMKTLERSDYYFHNFSEEDHDDLFDVLNTLNNKGSKWMLSYDDRNNVTDKYKDYDVERITVTYSGTAQERDKEFTEIVITNYEKNQTELF